MSSLGSPRSFPVGRERDPESGVGLETAGLGPLSSGGIGLTRENIILGKRCSRKRLKLYQDRFFINFISVEPKQNTSLLYLSADVTTRDCKVAIWDG